jgi:ubiquinone/menaquinone biosynthesis C-methylase UbiE
MLKTIARIVYYMDRLFPPVRVGGRESARAYAEWEHDAGVRLLEEYTHVLGPLAGRLILDIGCGIGGKTVAYADAGGDVIGIDIEGDKVAEAARFARERGSRARFVVADAGTLPFADGTFDVVIANDSMEHFSDPARALGELARVVRRGGHIWLFFTPWRSPLGSHLYDYIRTPWCHLLYSERFLENLLTVVLEKRGAAAPAGEAARLMEEYRTELNRITVGRFRRIVGETSGLETVAERLKPPKFPFLAPVTRVPLIGELFTGTVVAVLCKTT